MALTELKLENATLHIAKGNKKIGKSIYAFSTLPGNKRHLLFIKDKGLVTNVHGTCSKFCTHCAKDGACYAWRDAKLHHNVVIKAWGDNTLLLRYKLDELFAQIDKFITFKNRFYIAKKKDTPSITLWRWNVSGELENLAQLTKMNELALKHPETKFGIYTKNFDVLEEYLTTHPNADFAPNFTINISQWHGVADEFLKRHPNMFNVFEYDDSNVKVNTLSKEDKERLAKTTHCPAVCPDGSHRLDKNGEPLTCDKCNNGNPRCYNKTGNKTAVYAH